MLIGLVVGGGALAGGAEYYLTPLEERPFSPLHDLYAPTGLVGQGLGIVGTLMVVGGVVLYGARKRLPMLARVGKLKSWLHFHIFLCLLGPFLILLHTTFKFGGLVAISFWSMALVVASGAFGRWVYVWIPKTVHGRFLGAEEVRERMHVLLRDIEAQSGVSYDLLHDVLWPREHHVTAPLRSPSEPGRRTRTARPPASVARRPPAPVLSGPRDASELTGRARSVHALFTSNGHGSAAEPPIGARGGRAVPSPTPPTPPRGDPVGSADQRGPHLDRRGKARDQLGLRRAMFEALRFRLRRGRERRRFERRLEDVGIGGPIRARILRHMEEERRIEQQLRLLQPFQRAFRYWHAFHLPLAIVMFVVLLGHVAVAVAFGYTWIF